MNLRQWVYQVLSDFGSYVAIITSNRIYSAYALLVDANAFVDRLLQQARDVAQALIDIAPWWFSGAVAWMGSLVIDRVLVPAHDFVVTPLIYGINFTVGLWDGSASLFTPAVWIRSLVFHVRDRIDNSMQWAEDIANGINSGLTWLVSTVSATLTNAVNAITSALNNLINYVSVTIYNSILAVISGLQNTNSMVTQLYYDLQAIQANPVKWVWDRIEPELERRLYDILNRIPY